MDTIKNYLDSMFAPLPETEVIISRFGVHRYAFEIHPFTQ